MTSANSGSVGRRFDAVLIVSFGGPEAIEHVEPFLQNVARGRAIPDHRLKEVIAHYELFGGASPLNRLTRNQAAGLAQRLAETGVHLPVYVGMRHWHPFLADTLAKMSRAGIRRAVGFITAAHHSDASCYQYKQAVAEARRTIARQGLPDVDVVYVDPWYDHPAFIKTLARHVETALRKLDPSMRDLARIVFTAHSIPMRMAETCQYCQQLKTTAHLIARKIGRTDYDLVYQSRSGRPEDPWLAPDICDYLRAEHPRSLSAAVISPIGFVCDHIEVLYDLDREAAELCREIGLPMVRAETVNDDPLFIEMMAHVVRQKLEQYRRFPPLPIIAGQRMR